ncbi:HTTM domain-containing protein [Kitasatospora sp. NPDC057223]|uniref:HTTM domain-containing protein n=1 Tax=Kitasatospora sp. NPDC057223 TaxID=3346055 RepID=UPI003633737F
METEQTPAAAPSAYPPAPSDGNPDSPRPLARIAALGGLVTDRPVSLYASAVLRIGYGLLYLAFLLREFPHRDEIWGPGSPWTPALARQLFDQTGWFSILTLSDGPAYFEVCYAAAAITSALFVLGWRTRVVSILFAVVVASFHARAIFMTDGGDNLILLMALYLTCTACGRRWSLDARRTRLAAARKAERPTSDPEAHTPRQRLATTLGRLSTVLHNCAMFVIAAQVCVVYGSAGLYKVQGGTWQNGTALHYVMNLDLFRPWPALSLMVDSHPLLVTAATYLTVLLQVAFPFVLFGRLKYPVLAMLLGMHMGIAVLMGLPLFSGAMIVADAVFLPDRFHLFPGQLWRRAFPHVVPKRAQASSHGEGPVVPPQPGSAG